MGEEPNKQNAVILILLNMLFVICIYQSVEIKNMFTLNEHKKNSVQSIHFW